MESGARYDVEVVWEVVKSLFDDILGYVVNTSGQMGSWWDGVVWVVQLGHAWDANDYAVCVRLEGRAIVVYENSGDDHEVELANVQWGLLRVRSDWIFLFSLGRNGFRAS